MAPEGSITHWIHGVKAGEEEAAQKLWERYFHRLVRLARARLEGAPRRAADEEDVALAAFHSFCRGAAHGRFPQLVDRDDLWRLLVKITAHKALDQVKHERRARRGGGQVRGESARALEEVVGDEPAPDFALIVAEELEALLGALGDSNLRDVALWKMEGYTNEEIAGKLGCSLRSVARKLALIRKRLLERESGR